MSQIGFIGTGHIAAPMVRFLAARGHDVVVSERGVTVANALKQKHGVRVLANQAVVDTSDTVFLCLRPHHAEAVLAPLAFRSGQRIVSVMAGVPETQLHRLCAPAADFVQTIPLGFLEQGGCPLAAYGNAAGLADLFEPENPVIEVTSEAALNAHFAICAMVPGLLDLMASSSDWLARRTGNPLNAEHYTTQLMAGFLAAMEKGQAGQLAAERDALATDGTLSLQMTGGLRSGGAHDVLVATLDAIEERLNDT